MMRRDHWLPVDGMALEPNALTAAVEERVSVALTAGPGAGKTELLAQRADFLFQTGACWYPRRILAISFKVDAARNLRDRVEHRSGLQLASRFDSHTFHAFAKRIIDRYRPVLTGINALDPDFTIEPTRVARKQITFSDLVPLCLDIMQNSTAARSTVRQTYSHVFLDEFQDCNNEQYELIKELFYGTGALLTAVGDTKQRIMAFAGALEGIFIKFAADFSAQPLNLYQNFRSKPRLRRMQNAMIKVMDPTAVSSDAELEGDEGVILANQYANDEAEAFGIAEAIEKLLNEGTSCSEIAVLVSKQPSIYAAALMEELSRRGIAYRNEQSVQDLMSEPVVRLVMDFLWVVFSERKPESYSNIINVASGVSRQDDTEFETYAKMSQFLQFSRTRVRNPDFNVLEESTLLGLINEFLEVVGKKLIASLSLEYQNEDRLNNVIASMFSLLIEQVAVDGDPSAALDRMSEVSAIRIFTFHKSKGLEFENVIIMGVEEETFFGRLSEDRAAFFVGVSRAKTRLIVTSAQVRPNRTGLWRWSEHRRPHAEFFSYALAHVNSHDVRGAS